MNGCVTKKGNLYYVVYDDPTNSSGKRKQIWTKGYKRKKDAEKAQREIMHRIDNNTYHAPIKLSLGDYLLTWLDTYVDIKLQPTTAYGYRVNVEKHIIPYIGSIPLQMVNSNHIDELYSSLQKGTPGTPSLSSTSVIYVHRVLRKALQMAVAKRLISRNEADFATVPSNPRLKRLF